MWFKKRDIDSFCFTTSLHICKQYESSWIIQKMGFNSVNCVKKLFPPICGSLALFSPMIDGFPVIFCYFFSNVWCLAYILCAKFTSSHESAPVFGYFYILSTKRSLFSMTSVVDSNYRFVPGSVDFPLLDYILASHVHEKCFVVMS